MIDCPSQLNFKMPCLPLYQQHSVILPPIFQTSPSFEPIWFFQCCPINRDSTVYLTQGWVLSTVKIFYLHVYVCGPCRMLDQLLHYLLSRQEWQGRSHQLFRLESTQVLHGDKIQPCTSPVIDFPSQLNFEMPCLPDITRTTRLTQTRIRLFKRWLALSTG